MNVVSLRTVKRSVTMKRILLILLAVVAVAAIVFVTTRKEGASLLPLAGPPDYSLNAETRGLWVWDGYDRSEGRR